MGALAANGTSPAEKVCKACPRGARCTGDAIIANAGFWRQSRQEERLYRCRSGYCNAEQELVAGDDAEPEANAVCRVGHTGVLCASCVEGYALQGAYCERCKPSRVRASFHLSIRLRLCHFTLGWVDFGRDSHEGSPSCASVFLTPVVSHIVLFLR
jgi:hypothetical protein